jgi:exopolysaccharide biosynthesis predicted pyruvyltransferase EpsI
MTMLADTREPIAQSRSVLIAQMQDKTHDCLREYLATDEPIAMVDFPDYKNVGDSAIWLGQMAYLSSRIGKSPTYVSSLKNHSNEDLSRAAPSGPILITGGGTFGDIWAGHQELRESILEQWPGRAVIQLPQSIHYNSEDSSDRMARAIDRHKNFVLLVRDEESLDYSQKHFNCQVRLCPDMAFCIGEIQADAPTIQVLAMMREDKEQVVGNGQWAHPDIPREDWISESQQKVKVAKALGAASALLAFKPQEIGLRKLDAAAHNRFQRGITQISRGKAIVTDRLHVHICSLLLGRPHAVLDNSYGKIRRFMNAFSGGTSLSYKATSLDDGIAWARQQAAQVETE